MSSIGDLARQSSHYLVGRIAVMAAGLVSFPILTRIFSVGDYGLLGLLNTSLFILIAVTKLGFPNAIVRFYEEFRSREKLPEFYSTMFWGAMGAAAVASVCLAGFVWIAGDRIWGEKLTRILFLFPLLLFSACGVDLFSSFLRAEQRSKLYNVIGIARRYGRLALGVWLAVCIVKGLYGFFLGQVIASVGVLGVLGILYRKKVRLSLGAVSAAALMGALKFGFPLLWAELGDLVLNYADRYLVEVFLGRQPLGLYTAGYNLAMYVTAVVIQPINYAMTPIYMKILVQQGEEATREFFRTLLSGFVLVIAPLACVLVAAGKDLIIFLASAKFSEASGVLGYVVIGQMVYASTLILNCGLFIEKRTQVLTYLMLLTCLVNVGLNVVLIPRYGIVGAAQATLIAYVLYGILITYFSFRLFRFPVEMGRIFFYLSAAFGIYLMIRGVHFESSFVTLLVKGISGILVYVAVVLSLDRRLREPCLDFLRGVGRGPGTAS